MNCFNKNRFALLLVAGTLLVTVSSCKKYLDESPITQFAPNMAFADVNSTYHTLLGVYSQLSGEQGYGKNLSLYYMVDNDEMSGPAYNGNPAIDQQDRRSIAHYSCLPINSEIDAPYRQIFVGIERSNYCIKYIPLMTQYSSGTADEQLQLKRMYGEALTLRAQLYFEAIINWGDVPAQYVPLVDVANVNIPKSNRDSIYDHILGDLKTAEDLVPWRSAVSPDERITKGAVKALRARIALFRVGYSLRKSRQMENEQDPVKRSYFYNIALTECREIVASGEHHLNPSFKSVFKDALDANIIEPNGEVIFEVAMAGGTATTSSRLGNYDGPTIFGASTQQSAILVLPTYFYAFDSTDTRRDVTCAPYNVIAGPFAKPTTCAKINDGKFRYDWISPVPPSGSKNYDVNWPLIRYSDVLLMLAEAANEVNGGPTNEAYDAINQVRRRGYGLPITAVSSVDLSGLDYTGFFNAIVKERSLELGGEGVRKYDLLRWNLLKSKLDETKLNMDKLALGVAPYFNLPKSMMYKSNSPDLIFANSFYLPTPTSTPAGFTKTDWINKFYTPSTVGSNTLTTLYRDFGSFFQQGHSELLPIPQSIITSSNGVITQDYGY